jgi:hypothetical protein
VVIAENVRDAVQAEVACLWEELRGTGRSLSFLLPTSPGLWAVFAMSTLDAPCLCWCRVKGGGMSLDRAASRVPGGGGQATSPP